MSNQDGLKQYVLPQPNIVIQNQWEQHWNQQGQPWRKEPEISIERQKYLGDQRKIVVDARQGVYPFKGVELSRADIEWFLATHNDGRGPAFWNKDQSPPFPIGLDLRGAILRNVNLHDLPLAYLRGGFDLWNVRWTVTEEQRHAAAIHLEGASLNGTHLEAANLVGARLDDANLWATRLEKAQLHYANFHGASLWGTHLEEANLCDAESISDLHGANLDKAIIIGTNLEDAIIKGSSLEGATLRGANLRGTEFLGCTLQDADISGANLENSDFSDARMKGTNLEQAHLGRANFRKASFDHNASFEGARFSDKNGIGPKIGDVHWGDVDLTAVEDWPSVKILRDEDDANNPKELDSTRKDTTTRMKEYQIAARVYRQLSVVLRNQGLNEDAARFSYRAQLMQRIVYRYQKKYWQYLGSWFLALLAGYGYKPLRSFIAYLIVILAFATAYFIIGLKVGPALSPLGSVVFSMTSFHGRGFFPGGIKVDDPLTVFAALEAFIGLLIEVTFIATLTRRLFGS